MVGFTLTLTISSQIVVFTSFYDIVMFCRFRLAEITMGHRKDKTHAESNAFCYTQDRATPAWSLYPAGAVLSIVRFLLPQTLEVRIRFTFSDRHGRACSVSCNAQLRISFLSTDRPKTPIPRLRSR